MAKIPAEEVCSPGTVRKMGAIGSSYSICSRIPNPKTVRLMDNGTRTLRYGVHGLRTLTREFKQQILHEICTTYVYTHVSE